MPRVTAIFDADTTAFNAGAKQVSATGEKIEKQFSAKQRLFATEEKLLAATVRGETQRAALLQREVISLRQQVQSESQLAALTQRIGRDQRVTNERALSMARQRLAAEAAVTRELDRQSRRAAEYSKRGVNISGGRVPAAGKKGGGYSKGQDLTDAYNIGQDIVQGGIGAAANNVPRAIQLTKQIPGLISKISAAIPGWGKLVAVIGTASAYTVNKVQEIRNETQTAFEQNALARAEAERKLGLFNRGKAIERNEKIGRVSGELDASQGAHIAERVEQMKREAGEAEELARLKADAARATLEAIADEDLRTRKMRDHDVTELKRRQSAEENAAHARLEFTGRELKGAQDLYESTERRIAALEKMRKDMVALPEAQLDELNRLMEGRSGRKSKFDQVNGLRNDALRDFQGARANGRGTGTQAGMIAAAAELEMARRQTERFREATEAGLERAAEVAKQNTERIKNKVGAFLGEVGRGIETLQAAAEEQKKKAEQAKALGQLGEDVRIGELRGRGQNRRADRLQRQVDIGRETEKLIGEGATPDQAESLARRQADMRDPYRARRIRRNNTVQMPSGLDSGRPWRLDNKTPSALDRDPREPSALDWFRPRKDTIKGVGFKGPAAQRDSEGQSPLGNTPSPLVNGMIGVARGMAADLAEIRKAIGVRAINR